MKIILITATLTYLYFPNLKGSLSFADTPIVSETPADPLRATPTEAATGGPPSHTAFAINHEGAQFKLHGLTVADGLIPVAFFAMIVALVALRTRARGNALRVRLEAIRLLTEKGQPVPESFLAQFNDPPNRRSPTRRGVAGVGLGIGLGIYWYLANPSSPQWALGLCIFLIGLGNLFFLRKERSRE